MNIFFPLLIALLISGIYNVKAQSDLTDSYSFLKPDKEAVYPGGLKALTHDLGANLKYPKSARRTNLEGKVFVSFVVDEKGFVGDILTIKGLSAECDQAAIYAVSKLNRWIPALKDDKPVKSRFILPINFQR